MQAVSKPIDTLSKKIRTYSEIKAEKAALEETLKKIKAALDIAEVDAIDAMMDTAEAAGLADPTGFRVNVDGYNYSVGIKTHYSIKAEDKEQGFEALRTVGLGDLIVEQVDSRTLSKALQEIAVANGGALPVEFNVIPLQAYDKRALSHRKAGR